MGATVHAGLSSMYDDDQNKGPSILVMRTKGGCWWGRVTRVALASGRLVLAAGTSIEDRVGSSYSERLVTVSDD